MLTISLAIQAITGVKPHGDDRFIRDAVIDSRHTTPESLFIALPGDNVDGHEFVSEALLRQYNVGSPRSLVPLAGYPVKGYQSRGSPF